MQPADVNYGATYDAQPIYFRWKFIRTFGWILALLASTTLALGIADVVLTVNSYSCGGPGCGGEPYVWTWVAIGIWASVPVIIAGFLAMCLASNPTNLTKYFALFIYLSAIVFLPGMITLSSIEVWRGTAASPNFYNMPVAVGVLTPNPSSAVYAKFGLPLAIAVIGFVMFLMTAFMTLTLCFCMQELGIYRPKEVETYDGYQWTTMLQAQPQVIPAPAPVIEQYDQPDDICYNVPRPRPKFQNIIYTDQSINQGIDQGPDVSFYQPRRQFLNQYTPGPVAPAVRRPLPTRYTNTPNAYGFGGLYGNFSSPPQQAAQPASYMDDFVKPYLANFWK